MKLRMALLVASVIASAAAHAHATTPPPARLPVLVPVAAPAEPDAVPLYGQRTPGSADTETWYSNGAGAMVRNVTRPTLTPILPDPKKATGTAVLVAPGGAFMGLAMESEGWKVAHALADRGIAAFALKYRVMPTPADMQAAMPAIYRKMMAGLQDPTKMPTLQYPPSTDDALAALALIRSNAAKWHVEPDRVGMIGFSAGAMTAINTVLAAKPGQGPDFFGYIYGPQAKVDVPANAPPLFDAIALDDPLFPSMDFPIAEAWHSAKCPVEIHAFERGGHGFGLGIPGGTTSLVLDEFTAWLKMHGWLTTAPHN